MNHLLPSCQVSILGDPPKDVNHPQSAFLSVNNVFPSGDFLFSFLLSSLFLCQVNIFQRLISVYLPSLLRRKLQTSSL